MSSGWRVIFMPLSDTVTVTLQSGLRTGLLVKCLFPLPHGRNLAKSVHIKNNKFTSRWKTGLQLSSQASSKSRHLTMLGSVVSKAVAAIPPVKNVLPVMQEKDINIDSGVRSGLDRISVSDMEETPSKTCRVKISNANKGKVPWNKGRKHSPETLALIRERTKQAMRDPKIRKKLLNCAHPQSEHTKMKIGMAVRKALEEWRKRKKLQEICLLEWEENIAEAARIGAYGEDELQWDAYAILKQKMQQEWLQAFEVEKAMGKQKRKDKRAPKSVEQKKKISEAIRAKWEDPDYRQKVCSGMKNIYGNRSYSSVRRVVRKRNVNEDRPSSSVRRVVRKQTLKEDSSSGEKFNRIKQLPANRSTIEIMKVEAAERAMLLIAEAEKAAESLEAAAVTHAIAQASLSETRKLLSEAKRTLLSVESASNADGRVLQRNLGTNDDVETLQSNDYMDNSIVIPPSSSEPFDANSMHYLYFSNDGKANVYDTYESRVGNSLNDTLTVGISHHAHIYSHSTEIGRTGVLSYVNFLVGTPDHTSEDTAKIFEAMTDETVGNNGISYSDQNFSCPSVNHTTVVDKSAVLDNTEEFEERPVPNVLKDITLSVDAKSVAYNGQTENTVGISKTRSVDTDSTSNKDVRKMWVCGRFIEVKGD